MMYYKDIYINRFILFLKYNLKYIIDLVWGIKFFFKYYLNYKLINNFFNIFLINILSKSTYKELT